jgi:hypothetical protein
VRWRDFTIQGGSSQGQRVAPRESGKSSKIAVGRAQGQAMLDRESGEMSVGNKIPVHAGSASNSPRMSECRPVSCGIQTASQVSHDVTYSQAAAIDNGRGIILGFVDNRRNPSKDTQGIPSATESELRIKPISRNRVLGRSPVGRVNENVNIDQDHL